MERQDGLKGAMAMKYIVTSPSERTIEVEAKNSIQAKRKACSVWGRKPSDKWTGVPALKARRLDKT